ncbi:hypothetical protein, partial [Flavonifractor porci]|uniref:hypothetical protein n=1 Tax=Flavonifractor porci TaxID=3133422 RepID=UPI0030ACB1BC
ARRRQNRVRICFFQGHEPWKKHFSARKRARFARATQRAASLLKNACIFEKRVELSRHAEAERSQTTALRLFYFITAL